MRSRPGAPRGRASSWAPFDRDEPVFVLSAPFFLDTKVANNATMRELGAAGRRVDRENAMSQWLALYHHLAARSVVHILPSTDGLQDQPFVANLGVAIPRLEAPLVVLSRFRAAARSGEAAAGRRFFRGMNVETVIAPWYFEGEADFKHLRDRIFFAGHGLRSSVAAHRWFRDRHRLEVVPIPLHDPHLYHLDCVLHVLGRERVLLATKACPAETRRAVESRAEIIDVPIDLAYRGATNVARVGSEVLCDSLIPRLARSDPRYETESAKKRFWERLAARHGLTVSFFDLGEFHKSGAMLSCLVLPMNDPHLR